ncbi:MAG: hypothetical protein WKG01_32330, partial [Kofleriaceae bacterium]
GFALLGEVLLRRVDFERAVPVLQHAQNLDPTSPAILSMLRRARAGQPLDAPSPVPTPIPPRGETDNGVEIQRSRQAPPIAPPPMQMSRAPAMAQPQMVPTSAPAMPTMALQPPPMYPNASAPTFPEASAGFATQMPARPAAKQTAPPPMSVEGVRPRVIAQEKPQNAAAASLRQSASVGETYLNDLLTGGLLDVAGVRVPDSDFDLRPDRRWGRSTRRAFIFLFVVLVIGLGGGGTWYWWSEKQQAEEVAQLQRETRTLFVAGTFEGFRDSLVKLFEARESDKKNPVTYAYIAEAAGLQTLLYGTEPIDVINAIKNIGKELTPGAPGAREVVIGRAALELSRLHQSQTPGTVLSTINKPLDDLLAANEKDQWARWLRGRSHLAAGERGAARAAFKKAADVSDGLVVAMVDLANLDVDDGKIEAAMELFKQAVAKGKELHTKDGKPNDHPLAVLGKSLARAEGQFETDEAIGELNDNFDEATIKDQPRSVAYRALIRAILNGVENYGTATEQLSKATGGNPPGEARFWSRVAWVQATFGKTQLAKKALEKVTANKASEPDPTVELVDAALTLADGDPERALDRASKLDGVRAQLIRAYAFLDLDRGTDALAEADKVLAVAKSNVEAQILREQARMYVEKDRDEALKELESLARRAKSKLGRHALGVSLLKFGDKSAAKTQLEQAATLDEASPNPLLYRTHTALAEVAVFEKDPARAGKHIDEALKLNAEFFPTLMMRVRAVLLNNEPDRALTYLQQLTTKPAFNTPAVQMVYAEVLIRAKTPAKDKEQAKQIIIKLKDANVDPAELGRIAALLDPDLPKELELPAPGGVDKPKDPKPPRRRRK